MSKITNNCLQCGKAIRSGRSDKKFCDSLCKDAYNNEKKESERSEIRTIDLLLKKNRRVLKQLYDPKKPDKKFSRELLIRAGFEFGFLTHVTVTSNRLNEIVFCFDYGYREVTGGQFQIYPSFSRIRVKSGYVIKVS